MTQAEVNILLVGYGQVGKDIVGYVQQNVPSLARIAGIVDCKEQQVPKGVSLHVTSDIHDALERISADIVIDCTSIGQGKKNLAAYRAHGIPAIIQGGESQKAAPLYVPGTAAGKDAVRIPKCSATITNMILWALLEQKIKPTSLEASYYKVMPDTTHGKDCWEPRYVSGTEIESSWNKLVGYKLEARIASRYLRGNSIGRPIYSGDITMDVSADVTQDAVLDALNQSTGVIIVTTEEMCRMPELGKEALPLRRGNAYELPVMYQEMPLVPVIDESTVRVKNGTLKLHTEAVAPPVDILLNILAALEMTETKQSISKGEQGSLAPNYREHQKGWC